MFIDYWWFFRYNDLPVADLGNCRLAGTAFRKLCGDHEGDSEGITVVTDFPPRYQRPTNRLTLVLEVPDAAVPLQAPDEGP